MQNIIEISKKHTTDKIAHGYIPFYNKILRDYPDNANVLEIGIWHGESLSLWADVFPEGIITGINVEPNSIVPKHPRIKGCIGDATNPFFLIQVSDEHGPFDIIIDDGSHHNHHVIKSFAYLFTILKPGGTYVIEDTLCSYWPDYNELDLHPETPMGEFKKMADTVNFNGFRQSNMLSNYEAVKKEKDLDIYERTVEGVSFYPGLIVINKRS